MTSKLSRPSTHLTPSADTPGVRPAAASTRGPALSMRGITKRFPGVLANDRVDFSASAGEVHALLGENGAGKTTLSHVLTGLYRPDEGEIRLFGNRVQFTSPRQAIDIGLRMAGETPGANTRHASATHDRNGAR